MICWSSGTSSQRFDSRFRRTPFGRTLTEARPTGNLPFIALPSGHASTATPELSVEREQAYRQGRVWHIGNAAGARRPGALLLGRNRRKNFFSKSVDCASFAGGPRGFGTGSINESSDKGVENERPRLYRVQGPAYRRPSAERPVVDAEGTSRRSGRRLRRHP